MATQLQMYQMALRHLGDVRLATLTDDVAARYALDDAWQHAPTFVLRQAGWRFATITVVLSTPVGHIVPYSVGYQLPADWLRTHAIYITSNGRECPFDFREGGNVISTNAAIFPTIRYVSNLYVDPVFGAGWPDTFGETVAAYLAFLVAERVTGDPRQASRMSELFSQLLESAVRLDALDEDPWLPYQRDGSFLRVSRTMADQAFWRFAMKTQLMFTTPVPNGYAGFANTVPVPTDWARTRSLYVLTTARAPTGAGERRPLKVREERGVWYTDEASFYAEFVSSDLTLDSTLWPDHYMRAVLRSLHFDRATRMDDKDQKDDLGIQKDAIADALDGDASEADPWLEYQLDGSFDTASRAVIARGYWWWALKNLQLDQSQQLTLPAQYGFPYRYALPSDWLRTHALYVPWDGQETPINIRQTNEDWSTDAPAFVARYVSTDALDTATWPEAVAKAVLAYLDWQGEPPDEAKPEAAGEDRDEASTFDKMLADALVLYSLPEDQWLRFQLDGRYIQAVRLELEKGRWRFAVKTVSLSDLNNATNTTGTPIAGDPNSVSDGSVSPGYACRVLKPNDWLRTLRVYRSLIDGRYASWQDIDYRDELDALHVNYTPVVLRYLTRYGLDATRWPANFRDAILAWLQHCEAREDPKMAAVAKERLAFYQLQSKEAQNLDDERDMPRVVNTGRFVSGRYGRGGSLSDPQIAPPWWP